jgi:valyl-tRNA synthetase
MAWVISLIESIRSVRGEMNVPAALQVTLLRLDSDPAATAAWERNSHIIQRLARVETLADAPLAPKGSATIAVPGATFALPLADIIDVTAEKARLSKTLDKLAKDMGGLKGRLSNPRFVDSAPEEVIEETREMLAEKEAEAARLETALARLAEVA